ncbi:MAG TPA: ABC transporter permease DevC [Pirellulales bacterium]|nr:ABC transporter permease DevC [Pirellulales bacterium]
MRTPLAWKNLTHDRRRLLLALGGIGFAVLLMCMQLSFQRALLDSTVALIRAMNAELIITSGAKYTIVVRETFKRQRLYQARACDGVASAAPLYIETQLSLVTNRRENSRGDGGEGSPIRVLAFDPGDRVLNLAEVERHRDELRLPHKALYDERSKQENYGVDLPPEGETLQVADGYVELVGGFTLGTDFANDGNLIVGNITYLDLFPQRASGEDGLDDVDVGLVKVVGADVSDVQRRLKNALPDDVMVQTRREFEDQERRFWARSTPIGYIFELGTVMGFVVGMVICYQILYSDIADHLPEFATLKAMGYPNRYFVSVVLQEALLLSLLGFLPGFVVGELVCLWVAHATGLQVTVLEWEIGIPVLGLSVLMCIASGLLTMRKVMSADPAELFR